MFLNCYFQSYPTFLLKFQYIGHAMSYVIISGINIVSNLSIDTKTFYDLMRVLSYLDFKKSYLT